MTETCLNALLVVMCCFTVVLTVSLAPEALNVVIDFCKWLFKRGD